MSRFTASLAAAVAVASLGRFALADVVQVRVTVNNLAAQGGVALSRVTLAAHDGSFDSFNVASGASLGAQLVAEGGNGDSFIDEAHAAFPAAVTGVAFADTNAFGNGIYLPGGSGSVVLTLDTALNRFLSYGAMVVPSNDYFIGNDNPTGVQLFDADGNFVAQNFTLTGSRIWDAGTEVNQLFGAAFIASQSGADHVDENGVVTPGADFSRFLGELTPAGYAFSALPGADTPLASFSFELIPAPGAAGLLGLGALAAGRRRRR